MELQENQVQTLKIPECVSIPIPLLSLIQRIPCCCWGEINCNLTLIIMFYVKIFLYMRVSQFGNFTDFPLLSPGIDVDFSLFFSGIFNNFKESVFVALGSARDTPKLG